MRKNLYSNLTAQWAVYILFFIVVLAAPLVVTDGYSLNLMGTFGVYAMLALSISLGWGAGGILNLGQGVPFGLSAYGMAMMMQMESQDPSSNPMPAFMVSNSLTHLPWFWEPFTHPLEGVILSIALPTLFWMIFGSVMFAARVSGAFVAIMTIALLSALSILILDVQPYTNGANGITPPNALKLFGFSVDPYSPGAYLIVAVALVLLAGASKLLLSSRFGLVTHALRNDPERTRFLGYNVFAYQTLLFGFSGFIASIAGCCWVMLVQYVSPAQLDVSFSISMVIWAGVGGRMSLIWSMLGAILINSGQTFAGDTFLNTWLLILGFFFIIVVRFLPRGLAGLVEMGLRRLTFRSRVATAAAHASAEP
jgi:urea transport system permease protein